MLFYRSALLLGCYGINPFIINRSGISPSSIIINKYKVLIQDAIYLFYVKIKSQIMFSFNFFVKVNIIIII